MPTFLLIGIPIAVAVILFGIMTLPDEDVDKEMMSTEKPAPKRKKKSR